MIGLDSNILLRAIANDDPNHSPRARECLSKLTPQMPGVVNSVVLAEIAWTLRSGYTRSRQDVIARMDAILQSASYVVTDRDAVSRALDRCRNLKIEFSDALIGELNLLAGASSTVTFDNEAGSTPAFTLLS